MWPHGPEEATKILEACVAAWPSVVWHGGVLAEGSRPYPYPYPYPYLEATTANTKGHTASAQGPRMEAAPQDSDASFSGSDFFDGGLWEKGATFIESSLTLPHVSNPLQPPTKRPGPRPLCYPPCKTVPKDQPPPPSSPLPRPMLAEVNAPHHKWVTQVHPPPLPLLRACVTLARSAADCRIDSSKNVPMSTLYTSNLLSLREKNVPMSLRDRERTATRLFCRKYGTSMCLGD